MGFDPVSYLMGKEAGGGGSSVTVEPLSVSENGEYTAPPGKAYSPVSVDVPNSYTQSDEGKVVYNGELVHQSSLTVENNGLLDTTLYNAVLVDVPTIEKHIFNGATLADINDNLLKSGVGGVGSAVFGSFGATLTVGGQSLSQIQGVTVIVRNGALLLYTGATDGTMANILLLSGTNGNGLTTQQLYLIQSGTLTDLTAYGDQIISNVTITLYW